MHPCQKLCIEKLQINSRWRVEENVECVVLLFNFSEKKKIEAKQMQVRYTDGWMHLPDMITLGKVASWKTAANE
jgi:hypothetical protein